MTITDERRHNLRMLIRDLSKTKSRIEQTLSMLNKELNEE